MSKCGYFKISLISFRLIYDTTKIGNSVPMVKVKSWMKYNHIQNYTI